MTRIIAAAVGIVLAQVPGNGWGHDAKPDWQWTGTWGASPQAPGPNQVANRMYRQIVRISAGGRGVRIRLSNEFGTQAVTIGAARVAVSAGGAAIQAGTDHVLTFGGLPSVVIPAGAPILSDPVDFHVDALTSLAVSLYLPQSGGPATEHVVASQTMYAVFGDQTGVLNLSSPSTFSQRFYLSGVEVGNFNNAPSGAVIAFGDSITDGRNSTTDTNHRWPDRLAERLAASRGSHAIGVVNEGIAGNRLLADGTGPNALARIDRDVLATSGARFMIVLLGINDIGRNSATSDDLIAGYKQLIARAHSAGITIYGATLLPFSGASYFSETGETKRQAVNEWIRSSRAFDAVIDFDAVVRNPDNASQMAPSYDSGDHLHPNDAGYAAMADSVDLKLFRLDGEREPFPRGEGRDGR